MATSQMSEVIQHLRRTVLLRDGAGLTDGQLLEDYISRRDEAALAALVRRHGPMVWGVCRRVLRNHHDAEDAFQATFLVLVRKAASIASRELLANWLYGVAHQTALKARATAAKRKERERQVTEMPEPAVARTRPLARPATPARPRVEPPARQVSCRHRPVRSGGQDPQGSGSATRLSRRDGGGPAGDGQGRCWRSGWLGTGCRLSGGALAAVLSQQAASAGVPTSVVSSTIKAASLVAAGQAAATGAISVKVAALTEGVMKAMLLTKLKAVIAVVLMLGFVATAATALRHRMASAERTAPRPGDTCEPATKQEKEGFTAWGKEAGGLQAGWRSAPASVGPTTLARRSRWSSGFATSARRRSSSSTFASSSTRKHHRDGWAGQMGPLPIRHR